MKNTKQVKMNYIEMNIMYATLADMVVDISKHIDSEIEIMPLSLDDKGLFHHLALCFTCESDYDICIAIMKDNGWPVNATWCYQDEKGNYFSLEIENN